MEKPLLNFCMEPSLILTRSELSIVFVMYMIRRESQVYLDTEFEGCEPLVPQILIPLHATIFIRVGGYR